MYKDNSDLLSVGVISLTYTLDVELSAMHVAGLIFSHDFLDSLLKTTY